MITANEYVIEMNDILKEKIKHISAIIALADQLTDDVHDGLNHEILSTVVAREKQIFLLDQTFLSKRKMLLNTLEVTSLELLSEAQKNEVFALKESQSLIAEIQRLSSEYEDAKGQCKNLSNQIRGLQNEVKKAHKVKLAYQKSQNKL